MTGHLTESCLARYYAGLVALRKGEQIEGQRPTDHLLAGAFIHIKALDCNGLSVEISSHLIQWHE